jgi:hypothetical protein
MSQESIIQSFNPINISSSQTPKTFSILAIKTLYKYPHPYNFILNVKIICINIKKMQGVPLQLCLPPL